MSEERRKFETWIDVMSDFFRQKYESEEEKYLKEELKSAGKIYKKYNYFDNDDIEFIFDTRKNKKSKEQSALSFQRKRAIQFLRLKIHPEELDIDRKKEDYRKKVDSLRSKFTPRKWLSENSKNAGSVNFATHVIKLTHSKIDSPSLFDCIHDQNSAYLTTSSLKRIIIDGAVAGNQFAPIFQFLELELEGIKLAEQLAKDDHLFDSLLPLDEINETTKAIVKTWTLEFRKALNSGAPASHSLAKQVYFPVDDKAKGVEWNYHLLCNVVSSSLAHTIHEKVFDETQKDVKKAKEKERFSSEKLSRFVRRSTLGVTASNHSNASQLNAKRGGKLHLFTSQPPTWQTQLTPPIYRKSLFDYFSNPSITTELDYLRDFLLRFKQLDLSIKDPNRIRHLERWVHTIIDGLLFYVGSIQNLPPGWSDGKDIKLKKEHQYLLDPHRTDEAFQTARKGCDWQAGVRADFALWLNSRLRGKDKQFTPQKEHTRLWTKLLETPLREFMEPIEIELKQQARKSA